jgi:hypothetical protein
MRSFQSFRKQGMSTQFLQQAGSQLHTLNVILDILHDVLVAMSCQINFQSTSGVGGPSHHVHLTWVPLIISLGATSKIMLTTTSSTRFRRCKQKLQLLLKRSWHVTWYSWQLCGSFAVSPWNWKISYWTHVHKKTTCTQTPHESEL